MAKSVTKPGGLQPNEASYMRVYGWEGAVRSKNACFKEATRVKELAVS